MELDSLMKQVISVKDTPELSRYTIKNFLPDSMQTRNVICFVEDSDKRSYVIKFSKNLYLEREYELMKQICHPNIMSVNSFIKTEEFFGIVMPEAIGGDLLETFSNTIFLQSDVRHVMRCLFNALKYLHQYGIMHRDVKIENLLIMGKNISSNIVLSDFEFATHDKHSRDLFGVPAFVAPEMFRGQIYDFKVDIWSAGILMYLLCYGECPFDHSDNEYKLKFNDNPLHQVSEEEKDLMSHLLCLDPKERFTAEQALNHRWFSMDLLSAEISKKTKDMFENEISNCENFFHNDVS